MRNDALLTVEQAAEYLNIKPQTLNNWRSLGTGPRFVHVGRRLVRYSINDLAAYVAARTQRSTAENET